MRRADPKEIVDLPEVLKKRVHIQNGHHYIRVKYVKSYIAFVREQERRLLRTVPNNTNMTPSEWIDERTRQLSRTVSNGRLPNHQACRFQAISDFFDIYVKTENINPPHDTRDTLSM